MLQLKLPFRRAMPDDAQVSRRRKVKNGWQNPGNAWVPLVKHP